MKKSLTAVILGLCLLCGCSAQQANEAPAAVSDKTNIPEVASAETVITLSESGCTIDGSGASAENNIVTITKGGTYSLSGALSEGRIIVDAPDSEVTLILDGAEISCAAEPAIYAENAEYLMLYTAKDSVNTITSGGKKEISASSSDENASGGAVQAKCDMFLSGEGTLFAYGYINNAVQTSKKLCIDSGNIEAQAVNHGIKGNDGVEISGGSFKIVSGGDGLKSGSEKSEGSISISGGEFSLSAFGDGIQCDDSMEITSGSFDITTGGGSALAPQSNRGFGRDTSWDMDDESSISTKGIKCSGNMVISGGNYTIDSYDDAFHSDSSISISGGTIDITAGDDAVHADISLEVSAGTITASKCTEGLEANKLTINSGDINITSSDDGFNAYGGQSPMGFSSGGKTTSEQPELNINGGNIYICASGDGLDSNGNLTLNGGTVVVDGPSDSGNGAIDVGTESGGKAIVNGGTIIAVGSSGMAGTFDGSSKQYSFMCNLSSSFEAGTEITVSVGGKALFTHTSAKSGNSVVFSCPELKDGDVCTVTAGDISEKITLSGISTSAGQGGSGGFGKGQGGFGKGQGGFGRKELPEGFDPSEKPEMPDGMTPPDNRERPQDMTPPDNGEMPDRPGEKMPSDNKEEQVNI